MNENDHNWFKIGESSGRGKDFLKEMDIKAVEIEGTRYCLGRYQNKYFAINDRCPHAGASLSTGWCDNDGNVVCPLHRIAFNLESGQNTTGEGYGMESHPVILKEDTLYLGINNKKWYHFWK